MALFAVNTEWRSGAVRTIWVQAATGNEAVDRVAECMRYWCPLTESALEGLSACYLAPDQQQQGEKIRA